MGPVGKVHKESRIKIKRKMSENGTACSENVADKGRQPPALWAWRLERLSLGPLLGVETGKAEVLLLLLLRTIRF